MDEWTMTLSKKSLSVLGSLDNHGQRNRLTTPLTVVTPMVRVKRHEFENDHVFVGSKTIPGKRKKKVTPPLSAEQLRLLSRRIDPAEPFKPALPMMYDASPRKRLRTQPDNTELHSSAIRSSSLSKMTIDVDDIIINHTSSDTTTNFTTTTSTTTSNRPSSSLSSTLYQTCFDIWPGEPSLGDLAHDKIKNLSELLKVRLSQAKFRVIAALEAEGQDSALYRQLKSSEDECSIWPAGFIGKKHKIKLSRKCNQAPWGVTVGNSRNLKRQNDSKKQIQTKDLKMTRSQLPSFGTTTTAPLPSSSQQEQQERLKQPSRKAKCGRQAADPALAAVTLQDGSRAFICKDCNKKYKNRNGLVYHRDRCKQRKPIKPINCACGEKHPSDNLVQCETCHLYSHLECIGLDENELNNEGAFHCPTCVLLPTQTTDKPYTDLSNTTMMQGQQQIWEDFSMSPSSNTTYTSSTPISDHVMTPSLYYSNSDLGLMTPSTTSNTSVINTPSPSSQQSDSQWFDFANFDTDFTFNDSQTEQ
ncbi:hypothetical protein BDC45DRAFT_308728 [Circinella umbellata]|nr:hypothetical protein BDC45DRAFT_308728 [Circinella umbellata]